MSTAANPNVYDWRWGDDTSDPNTPDWDLDGGTTTLSTTYEVQNSELDTTIFLYIGIENDGDMSATDAHHIYYENTTQATGENQVTTTSNHVRVSGGIPADATVITTPGVLGAGAGTWVDGEYDEGDGQVDANCGGGQYTNYVWAITFRSADVNAGDSIDIYYYYGGAKEENDSGATINVTIGAAAAGSDLVAPMVQNYRNMGY